MSIKFENTEEEAEGRGSKSPSTLSETAVMSDGDKDNAQLSCRDFLRQNLFEASDDEVRALQLCQAMLPANCSTFVYERLKQLRTVADKAIQECHVFTVLGPYTAIKNSLKKRGWVEKMYDSFHAARYKRRLLQKTKSRQLLAQQFLGTLSEDEIGEDKDKMKALIAAVDMCLDSQRVLSRMVRYAPSYFIWTRRRDHISYKHLQRNQLVNHFPNAEFTTKIGLTAILRDTYWFSSYDVRYFYPRCYSIGMDDDQEAFIEDFHMTTCLNVLKWVVHQGQLHKSQQMPPLTFDALRVPIRAVEMALQHCNNYIRLRNHEDIDADLGDELTETQWTILLEWYYQLAHHDGMLPRSNSLYEECTKMLQRIRRYWPQIDLDGMHNVWIVKPGAKSRGMGIMIFEKLDDITSLITPQMFMKGTKYVVQKYIERPLLIYNTKFDIRQWFVVTDWNPLTLYFYKDSYLRFCSKPFNLKDKSEAIHLCNNSIQRNYIKRGGPKSVIPEEFMWTCAQFQEHLRLRGKGNTWNNIVYPRMKKAVIATVCAAQDNAQVKKGCFELFGADFMLTEDYHPWLIEINASPCMAPTTKVTAKLCNQILEDIIKVLVDKRDNRNASIGRFEVAYRHNTVSVPPYTGTNLAVQGIGITLLPSKRPPQVRKRHSENKENYHCPPNYKAKLAKSEPSRRREASPITQYFSKNSIISQTKAIMLKQAVYSGTAVSSGVASDDQAPSQANRQSESGYAANHKTRAEGRASSTKTERISNADGVMQKMLNNRINEAMGIQQEQQDQGRQKAGSHSLVSMVERQTLPNAEKDCRFYPLYRSFPQVVSFANVEQQRRAAAQHANQQNSKLSNGFLSARTSVLNCGDYGHLSEFLSSEGCFQMTPRSRMPQSWVHLPPALQTYQRASSILSPVDKRLMNRHSYHLQCSRLQTYSS